MALLYDENFQSYAIGSHPPFANFQSAALLGQFGNPTIVSGGGYGDSQDLNMGPNAGVIYPILPPNSAFGPGDTYSSLGVPAYSNLSISMYINQAVNADQQGQIITVHSLKNPNAHQDVAGIRILTDGTIAITAPASSAFSTNQAISDFALHTNTIYWLQVNCSFGASGSFMTANITVAVNGIPVVSSSWVTGEPLIFIDTYGFSGNFWNAVKISGSSIGMDIGRVSIYNSLQSIPSYTHPGSPVAFVNQGVIELIKSLIPPALDIICPSSTASFGVFYDSFFTASGGVPPYTWTIVGGALPPGLTLNAITGELSGTPTHSGVYSYTVRVTDFLGNTHDQSCSITVAALPVCAERFGPKLYYWEPSYLERPEDTFLRATDWDNCGYEGLKFIQGVIVEADTEGVDRHILIQGDQANIETVTVNHAGQLMNAYSLTQPYEAHMVRIIPQDQDLWRLFNLRWVFEPAPEYVYEWKTQGTDHDLPGFQFLKSVWIAHRSTVDITLTINVDGTDFVYTIPNSGGVYKKTYLLLAINGSTGQCLKGKLFTYELRSSDVTVPFQLFEKDSEVRVHSWAGGGYLIKLPFGDIHRVSGARL